MSLLRISEQSVTILKNIINSAIRFENRVVPIFRTTGLQADIRRRYVAVASRIFFNVLYPWDSRLWEELYLSSLSHSSHAARKVVYLPDCRRLVRSFLTYLKSATYSGILSVQVSQVCDWTGTSQLVHHTSDIDAGRIVPPHRPDK